MAEDERFFSRQIYLVAEISEFRSAKYFKCFESFLFISPSFSVGRPLPLPFYLRHGRAAWRESDGEGEGEKKKGKELRETLAERGECITCRVTGSSERRRRKNREEDFSRDQSKENFIPAT